DAQILGIVLGEAAFVGAAIAIVAVVLSFPLTLLIDGQLAATGMLSNPPFAVAPLALVGWPLVTVLGSVLAALPPARRASRLTATAALAEL
ncbi:MAG: FtsX-like permease family protein, partial [Kofleriaceae bacterium]